MPQLLQLHAPGRCQRRSAIFFAAAEAQSVARALQVVLNQRASMAAVWEVGGDPIPRARAERPGHSPATALSEECPGQLPAEHPREQRRCQLVHRCRHAIPKYSRLCAQHPKDELFRQLRRWLRCHQGGPQEIRPSCYALSSRAQAPWWRDADPSAQYCHRTSRQPRMWRRYCFLQHRKDRAHKHAAVMPWTALALVNCRGYPIQGLGDQSHL